MQIHTLQLTEKRKNKKRVGRGGKRGTYSGRGEKGQRKRSGHRILAAERTLFMRMPKLRGIKHPRITAPAKIVSVGQLESIFGEGILTKKMFVEKRIIKSTSEPLKILDGGDVKRAFQIQGVSISKSAKAKIEKAGGSVKEIVVKK